MGGEGREVGGGRKKMQRRREEGWNEDGGKEGNRVEGRTVEKEKEWKEEDGGREERLSFHINKWHSGCNKPMGYLIFILFSRFVQVTVHT